MSNIYIQEPPTNGKVLLVTSCGDIDIELWSKEAPKACRNFVQLCMEGYYDGTLFHRVVKDFIVQGGDPTGTGEGGESIYGKPFKDEIHSRLRFVRRGLVAMANAGPNDNGSQFFFTLGAAPELQKKHTIFGKVAGNTVYNMIKLAEVDIGPDDRPSHPHKIIKTEILFNPFDDIVPRVLPKRKGDKEESGKKKSKSKATKNFSLLSFGEEAEEDEEEVSAVSKAIKTKGKSSHDYEDPSLSAVPAVETNERLKRKESDEDSEDEGVRDRIHKKLKKEPVVPEKTEPKVEQKTSRKEELRKEARELKKEMHRAKEKSEVKNAKESEEDSEESEPVAVKEFRQEREKYKILRTQQKKKGAGREEQTLAILAKFQSRLHDIQMQPAEEEKKETADENEDEDEGDDLSWLGHKLEFEDKSKKVMDANVAEDDRYEIFDPRNPMNQRRREASKQAMKDKKEKR